jgi:hypothetical protein
VAVRFDASDAQRVPEALAPGDSGITHVDAGLVRLADNVVAVDCIDALDKTYVVGEEPLSRFYPTYEHDPESNARTAGPLVASAAVVGVDPAFPLAQLRIRTSETLVGASARHRKSLRPLAAGRRFDTGYKPSSE